MKFISKSKNLDIEYRILSDIFVVLINIGEKLHVILLASYIISYIKMNGEII